MVLPVFGGRCVCLALLFVMLDWCGAVAGWRGRFSWTGGLVRLLGGELSLGAAVVRHARVISLQWGPANQ